MIGALRSKQGCWTCRLRKKKCTESRPRCSICEALAIPCYGYGPKPEWMDDGDKEKAISNSLKEIVKHTSRRKTTAQDTKFYGPNVRIAPKPVDGAFGQRSPRPASCSGDDASSISAQGLTQREPVTSFASEIATPEELHCSISKPTQSISANDSVLLMHYLDLVFPLQYPGYKPEPAVGRSWLVSLLLQTKSLYHATLALSAHHRRTVISEEISQSLRLAALVQQEVHLEISIKTANQAAQNSCPKNGVGIATAVVQLYFYELFTGGNAWKNHLRAAINMYQRGNEKDFSGFGLAQNSREVLSEDLPLPQNEPLVAEEVVHFRFLRCTLLWLDIVFAITAGIAPQLPPNDFCVVAADSQTKLEKVMGCENRVLLQIGRIATRSRNNSASQQGDLGRRGSDETVDEIRREMQVSHSEGSIGCVPSSKHDSITTINASNTTSLVTSFFAKAGIIYLHLVKYGYQDLGLLDATITEAMGLLQTKVSTPLLPALVCPLFFIGSVAKPENKEFFRDIFSSPPLLDPALKHRERVLPVLEEIWNRRGNSTEFGWNDVLELTHDILLI